MRILITGAAGRCATFLRPYLRDKNVLMLHDRVYPPTPLSESEHAIEGDILSLESMLAAVDDIDAVIHLAGESYRYAGWESVRDANIEGTYNTFEAARQAGIRKIVFASSNHVMGMYDTDEAWPIDPLKPVRPDSLYGVSKVLGEALGQYFSDTYNMSIICLRIGWVLEKPFNEQGLRMWLSPRDFAQLVSLSLSTHVSYGVYYGVSANTRNKWIIDNAQRELGFMPEDDSELFASEIDI